ncbi:MAG: ROK family protein, partial [Planctomycetes bacterium]|nr:ROK family protein [Planctomycetota bacterium]
VWSHYGTYLGMGISGLINIFNPEVVLLGGGISKAFKLFESSMHRQISLSYKIILTDCRITTSKFPDDGGLLGASYLAIESLKP